MTKLFNMYGIIVATFVVLAFALSACLHSNDNNAWEPAAIVTYADGSVVLAKDASVAYASEGNCVAASAAWFDSVKAANPGAAEYNFFCQPKG